MGHGATVQWLLARGAHPLARDHDGCTPLHWAALRGRQRAVDALLRHGGRWRAQLGARDSTRSTPLELAAYKAGCRIPERGRCRATYRALRVWELWAEALTLGCGRCLPARATAAFWVSFRPRPWGGEDARALAEPDPAGGAWRQVLGAFVLGAGAWLELALLLPWTSHMLLTHMAFLTSFLVQALWCGLAFGGRPFPAPFVPPRVSPSNAAAPGRSWVRAAFGDAGTVAAPCPTHSGGAQRASGVYSQRLEAGRADALCPTTQAVKCEPAGIGRARSL